MTEPKFTPWRRADSEYYFNVVIDNDCVIKLEKALNRNQLLKNQANAHLIASAPDLYKALSDILVSYCDGFDYDDDEVVIQARAALAKARGET